MDSRPAGPHFAQVALSVADMAAALRFYVDVLGFQSAGGRYAAGPGLAAVQGLTDPSCAMWWLVNEQPFFQLELFQYSSPTPHPRPEDWGPTDIGYTTLTFAVADVPSVVARAASLGCPTTGRSLIDPTGIPIALIEGAGPARLVGLAASVTDLAASRAYFGDGMGMVTTAAHDNGTSTGFEAAAGDVTLRLTQHSEPPSRPRREGFQLNDHGILNIALGYRDWDEFNDTQARVVASGYRAETAPMGRGGAYDVSYCTDHDGFSVELLYCPESSDQMLGFTLGPGLSR